MSSDEMLLGLDIGGTFVRAALARQHRIVASRKSMWPPNLSPIDEAHFVADLALDLMRRSNTSNRVSAAGVSLAALTDHTGSVVQWPNRPAWRGLAFKTLLERWLEMPVVVEDDANASTLAEWTYGAGRGYQHLLVMIVGTGVGAGLILDGHLFRGRHGWAGELGHVVVSQDGPACLCGHRGCLQVVASGRALERIAAERGLANASAVTDAAKRGEDWARLALATCGRWLGVAAANAVNLLDLEAVVVGGGLGVVGDPLWSALEEALQSNLLNQEHCHVALLKAKFSSTSGLRGAISLAEKPRWPERPSPRS